MSDDKRKLFRPDAVANPFETYDTKFKQNMQAPYEVFGASPVSGKEEREKRAAASSDFPTAVAFPPHLYAPEDSQSIDIAALANVPPLTTVNILEFRARKGGLTRFLGYAIFNDALDLSSINLVPTVNGARVFPFHGNPQLKFKMGLGTSADMATLVPCLLDLQPNDILAWTFTNNDIVDVAVGVRMNGYFSQGIKRIIGRFGG